MLCTLILFFLWLPQKIADIINLSKSQISVFAQLLSPHPCWSCVPSGTTCYCCFIQSTFHIVCFCAYIYQFLCFPFLWKKIIKVWLVFNKLHMLKVYNLVSLNIYETVTTSRRMNILLPLIGLSHPVLLLHPASLFYWWWWCFRQEPKSRSCYFVMVISGHFSPIVSQTLSMISLSFSLSFTLIRFSLSRGLLEKKMATHSSILAWEIPWTEEPGGLQSMGSVRHDLASKPPPKDLLMANSPQFLVAW